MSSDTVETADEQTHHHSDGSDAEVDTDAASDPLTIDLPDGTANIAEAIRANRDVLHNPSENGLAADEDISHLSEAVGDLSQKLQQSKQKRQEAEAKRQETESRVDELEMTVAHQQRQIQELRSVVESLMDILGTSTEWESFDSEAVDSEHATE